MHSGGGWTDRDGMLISRQLAKGLLKRLILRTGCDQPDSRTSLTAASSSTPIAGREKGKNSDIAFPSAIEYLSTYICYKECCVYFAIWSEILRIEY